MRLCRESVARLLTSSGSLQIVEFFEALRFPEEGLWRLESALLVHPFPYHGRLHSPHVPDVLAAERNFCLIMLRRRWHRRRRTRSHGADHSERRTRVAEDAQEAARGAACVAH